jgi:hypothetical protein
MAFILPQKLTIYHSAALTAEDASSSDTIKSLVFGAVVHSPAHSIEFVSRDTQDPAGDRSVLPFITRVDPISFSFKVYLDLVEDAGLGAILGIHRGFWFNLMNCPNDLDSAHDSYRWNDAVDHATIGSPLHLWFDYEDVTYLLRDAQVDSITVNFDLNNLCYLLISGRAFNIEDDIALPSTFIDYTQQYRAYSPRLTTISIIHNSATYILKLASGSITYSGNVTYSNSNELGKVSVPNSFYRGSKEVTGELTVYLKSGTDETVQLFKALQDEAHNDTIQDYPTDILITVPSIKRPAGDNVFDALFFAENCILGVPTLISGSPLKMMIPFYAPCGDNDVTGHAFGSIT